MGLSRLALRVLTDPVIRDEIEAAIAATRRHLGSGGQHLCCGEAGRILFLEYAGRLLERRDLTDLAIQSASALLDSHDERGCWCFQQVCERSIIPGFLDGIGGIGWMLLQVSNPRSWGNLLVLD